MNQMIDFALLAAEDEVADTERVPYICGNDPVEGDVVCITGGSYPENYGKLCDVTAVHSMLWITPRGSESEDEGAPLPGISENDLFVINDRDHGYRFVGVGETCFIDRADVRVVA